MTVNFRVTPRAAMLKTWRREVSAETELIDKMKRRDFGARQGVFLKA
jgi:hypothetical protein